MTVQTVLSLLSGDLSDMSFDCMSTVFDSGPFETGGRHLADGSLGLGIHVSSQKSKLRGPYGDGSSDFGLLCARFNRVRRHRT